jgi:hypothetical protein
MLQESIQLVEVLQSVASDKAGKAKDNALGVLGKLGVAVKPLVRRGSSRISS